MDEGLPVSTQNLYAQLGTAAAPVVIDVRRREAFGADDRMIVGAFHRSPDDVERWRSALPADRPVVAYCVHGHEVSQGVAGALARSGVQAAYLAGRISAWREQGLPTRRKEGGGTDK